MKIKDSNVSALNEFRMNSGNPFINDEKPSLINARRKESKQFR
jgi:hypothetical protein